jgi:hypothetical protein
MVHLRYGLALAKIRQQPKLKDETVLKCRSRQIWWG